MIRRILRRDEGLTLVELSIAMLVAAVIASAMVAWLVQVSQQHNFAQESEEALAAMTLGKARLVKELRFADELDMVASDSHSIVLWVDENGNGASDSGETVTWTIESDGDLVRATDTTIAAIQVTGLVYDAGAAAGSSRFSYGGAGERVTIELTADVESGSGPLPKSIRTEVHLRNA